MLYADILWKMEDQSLSQLFWMSTNPKEYKTIAPKDMILIAVIAMLWKVRPIPPTPNSSRVFP